MPIVMKFGGSSLADAQKILKAASIAVHAAEQGERVVVVVSAQGDHTDALIEKMGEITANPPARELDALLATGEFASCALMAAAIESLGRPAVSLSGRQAGILTYGEHGDSRIHSIDTYRLSRELDDGKIAVVAGFQGVSAMSDVTTIGRGGSDTTAVALAAALGGCECRIFTDVSGVYSADPRVVPDAVCHGAVGCDEMNTLASMGAQVLHGRSVSMAKSLGVPVTVLSCAAPGQAGTRLEMEPADTRAVTAVTCESGLAHVRAAIGRGSGAGVLAALAGRAVSADMAAVSGGEVCFCVPESKLAAVRAALSGLESEITSGAAKISAVGSAIHENPAVAARMFAALEQNGLTPLAFSTGDLRVSALLPGEEAQRAVKIVHKLFF